MIAGGGTYQGEPRSEARHSRVKGCFHFIRFPPVAPLIIISINKKVLGPLAPNFQEALLVLNSTFVPLACLDDAAVF